MEQGNEEKRKTLLPNNKAEENNTNQTGNHVLRDENGTGKPRSESREDGAETVKINGILEANGDYSPKHLMNGQDQILHPHSLLPQPEAPPGLTKSSSNGEDCNRIDRLPSDGDRPSIGRFLRDSIKRISLLKESDGRDRKSDPSPVTEFHLSGLKVIVKSHGVVDFNFNGRISFFSRSGCRESTAVRSFFRERGLRFVEINVDVYAEREKELIRRSGSASVPKVFFNEKMIGGLEELNLMVDGGDFEMRVREMMRRRCPESGPAVPVYGFDDPDEEEWTDEMVGIVRVLRQRLPIQDRMVKMKMVKNCFMGKEMVEVMIEHLDCGRKKAVEIGKVIARKHFIHHVFQENDFEDGNHLYRFLEHEPIIPRCFNFRGSTNDNEPKPTAVIGRKLTKIMSAILEAYGSEDCRHVDYNRIRKSEEFRRYVNLVQDLQRVDVLALSEDEKLAFFLNLYNAMIIHAVMRNGCPEGVIDRRTFYDDFNYIVGGYPYSLTVIKNGILRSNRRQPYSLIKPFNVGDKRLEVALPKVNPLIHFGLCNGTRSSPTVRFFSAEGIDAELRVAARDFFIGGAMEVDLDKRTVYFSRIIKWYCVDFVPEKDILKWILNYLDATKAGLLMHLLSDGGPINFVYQKYDWSLNSEWKIEYLGC